jgi:hypothetical protein
MTDAVWAFAHCRASDVSAMTELATGAELHPLKRRTIREIGELVTQLDPSTTKPGGTSSKPPPPPSTSGARSRMRSKTLTSVAGQQQRPGTSGVPGTPSPQRRQPCSRAGLLTCAQRNLILSSSAMAVLMATTIGLAPLAAAKGKSPPATVCTGSEIFLGQCDSKVPQVGSVKILAPKGKIRTYPDSACVRSVIPPKQPDLPNCQLP